MIKISNRQVLDVIKLSDDKAIFVEKKPSLSNDSYTVSYFVLNFSTGKKEIVTKDVYLLKKYGPNRKIITDRLGNFVTPSAMVLQDKTVLVLYPTGNTGLFDEKGQLSRDGMLSYNDSGVACIAEDGEYFWTACQEQNCVIRYLADGAKMDIRIGSKEQNTFDKPHFVSADDEYIYVCCNHSIVRKINKTDFTVSDLDKSYSSIIGFYKFGRFSIITTLDGAYCDKD